MSYMHMPQDSHISRMVYWSGKQLLFSFVMQNLCQVPNLTQYWSRQAVDCPHSHYSVDHGNLDLCLIVLAVE